MDPRILIVKLVGIAIESIVKHSLRPKLAKKIKRRHFSESTKLMVRIMQGLRCKMCGRFLDVVDYHHVDGNMANNHISNCVALCPNCHRKIK